VALAAHRNEIAAARIELLQRPVGQLTSIRDSMLERGSLQAARLEAARWLVLDDVAVSDLLLATGGSARAISVTVAARRRSSRCWPCRCARPSQCGVGLA